MGELVSCEQLAHLLNKPAKTVRHTLKRLEKKNKLKVVEKRPQKTAYIGRFSYVFYVKPECALELVRITRRSKERQEALDYYAKHGKFKPLPSNFIDEKIDKQRLKKLRIQKLPERTEFPPLKTDYVIWLFGGQGQFVNSTKILAKYVNEFGEYVPEKYLPTIYRIIDSDAK